MSMTSPEVAARLGVSRRRASALLQSGQIRGSQLPNGLWLVSESAIQDYFRVAHQSGRPWSCDLSWHLVLALSEPQDVASARLLARLERASATTIAAQVGRLITVKRYQARNTATIDKARQTGESALARISEIVIGSSRLLHCYAMTTDPIEEFDAVPFEDGTLAVHTWRDSKVRGAGIPPVALVAIDCANSADSRVREAGLQKLNELLARWRAK